MLVVVSRREPLACELVTVIEASAAVQVALVQPRSGKKLMVTPLVIDTPWGTVTDL